jgi:FkbM family methyltransferase
MSATVEPLSPSDEQLDLERVIEVDTDVGSLWLERKAQVLTPTLIESGRWEPDVTDLLSRLLRPGMTVVDAGANIGYLSVHASKLVGPTGKVFCVEADPANVSILRKNLWKNGCANAVVLPVAVWSERAELNLRVVPDGGACTQVSAADPRDSTVAAYRLDDLIDETVDYLKIDCEGTDHLVLRGATGLFRANRRMIATVEFVPDHDSHTGDTARDILRTYEELGLKPFAVSARGHLRPTTYERLASSGMDDRLVVYDFALSTQRPTRLLLGYYIGDFPKRSLERLLKLGGDLLEYVPERIRPRIRRRDRAGSR